MATLCIFTIQVKSKFVIELTPYMKTLPHLKLVELFKFSSICSHCKQPTLPTLFVFYSFYKFGILMDLIGISSNGLFCIIKVTLKVFEFFGTPPVQLYAKKRQIERK